MSSVTSRQAADFSSSLAALSESCRAAEVDAELLHHSIEKQASACYSEAHKFVQYTRWGGALCLVSAAAACAPLFYLNAKVYRGWRLRHPQRVRQYQLACAGGGVFAVTTFLFLISPIGFVHMYDHRWQQGHELDALAVRALTLRQDYRTLQYWVDVLRGARPPLTAERYHQEEAASAVRASRRHDATDDVSGSDAMASAGAAAELPWVRITHLTAAPPAAKAAEPVVAGAFDGKEALAAALFKGEQVVPPHAEVTKDGVPLVPVTWTLRDLRHGQKQHGAAWLEEELQHIARVCAAANEDIVEACGEVGRRVL